MFNFKHTQNGVHSDYNGVFGALLTQITNGTSPIAEQSIDICKTQSAQVMHEGEGRK